MRLACVASLLLLFGANDLRAQQTAADSVRSLDQRWGRAYAVHDTAFAQQLFAPNIVITNSAGAPKTRDQELSDVRPAPGLVMNYFRTEDVDVHVTPRDAAVVGTAAWEFVMNGRTQNLRRRYSATYTRGGPLGWQMVALHLFMAPATVATSTATPAPSGVAGRWEGVLGEGATRLRLVLELTKAADGLLLGTLESVDQGNTRFPIDRVRETGDSLELELRSVQGRYAGVISTDKTRLIGAWSQAGQSSPLTFTRAATTTAAAPAAAPPSPTRAPFGLLAEVSTPVPPTPFTTAGKTNLVFEVHVTNFMGGDLLVSRLDIVDGRTTLMSYEGADLTGILTQARQNVTDARSIPAGGRAVAFVWVSVDSGRTIPKSVRSRIWAGGQSLDGPEVVVSTAKPIVVGPPLRGADWVALNGPANASGHRRALIPLGGRPEISQRFAIDWVKYGPSGSRFSGDSMNNASYFAYGSDILSVGDGVVTSLTDGIPQNVPGITSRAVPITLETVGGNYVIVDMGSGHYAFYAHMQPGSLRVKVGDRVRRGQILGLVGNSGNSTEPHLHFHISSANAPLAAEGLPYLIDSWDLAGAAGERTPQRNQLPLANVRARFSGK